MSDKIFHFHLHCRQFLLENMKLFIEHPASSDLNLLTKLYKMQTEQLSFERFEELFDREEDEHLPDEPLFDNEWKPCQVNLSINNF